MGTKCVYYVDCLFDYRVGFLFGGDLFVFGTDCRCVQQETFKVACWVVYKNCEFRLKLALSHVLSSIDTGSKGKRRKQRRLRRLRRLRETRTEHVVNSSYPAA
jgi:hypothetical protein